MPAPVSDPVGPNCNNSAVSPSPRLFAEAISVSAVCLELPSQGGRKDLGVGLSQGEIVLRDGIVDHGYG